MAEYKAICVLNWDDTNLADETIFTHVFNTEEVNNDKASNGDIFTFIWNIYKLKQGYDAIKRLNESGADRIDIRIERVNESPALAQQRKLINQQRLLGKPS
ncbi:MAG: hypothetical protein K0U45_08960 [Alphaproteobacteria bacterium]|nr:hypothetical protein [Alphaproteobacteria bacterium]